MAGAGLVSHPWLDEDRDSVLGDSMDWLEQELERSPAFERAEPRQAWAPVLFPPGCEEAEPDSLDLMEAFLGPAQVQPPARPPLEVAMANGTRPKKMESPAPANGANGKEKVNPGWIFLAAESLANFEALRLRGQELPAKEDLAETRG
jgi:hypothetical protein